MQQKNNDCLQFSDRLVFAMKERGLNSPRGALKVQIQPLAEAAGVSHEMARRYLLGTAEPKSDDVKRTIATWLNVSYTWLLTGEGEPDGTTIQAEINATLLKDCINAVKKAADDKGLTLTDDQVINTAIYLYEGRDLEKAASLVSLLA